MRIVKHNLSLEIVNLDLVDSSTELAPRHGALLPNTVRGLICGPSGCGKTNAMLSLLYDKNGLKFENVYVYSKSLFQPKYELLKKILDSVKGVGYYPYTENDDVIDPTEAKENSVFIFDDVACDKQDKIRMFFSMGRHKKVDSFYLCQTYTKVPKHLIRDNANIIILFKQDDINLKHVYDEHVTTDMSFNNFKEMCGTCWKNNHDMIVIVKDSDLDKGRYRKGFDEFIFV